MPVISFDVQRYEIGIQSSDANQAWGVCLVLHANAQEVFRVLLSPQQSQSIAEGLMVAAQKARSEPPPASKH